MTPLAAIAGLVSVLVAWLVTLRVFALARRTRALPERLLAVGFGGLFCVGYPLAGASRAPGMSATNEGALIFAIAMIGVVTGIVALALFPRVVFRPGRRWATALCLAIGFVGAVAGTGSAVAVARARTPAEIVVQVQPWAILLMASLGACFLWQCVESTLYYRSMKRRLVLGLVSPATTHRFLLWALASGFALAPVLTLGVLRASGVAILSSLPTTIIAVAALVTSLCWWLAFFMPRAYRIHVVGDPAEDTPG